MCNNISLPIISLNPSSPNSLSQFFLYWFPPMRFPVKHNGFVSSLFLIFLYVSLCLIQSLKINAVPHSYPHSQLLKQATLREHQVSFFLWGKNAKGLQSRLPEDSFAVTERAVVKKRKWKCLCIYMYTCPSLFLQINEYMQIYMFVHSPCKQWMGHEERMNTKEN